jgi:exonuclease III
MLQWNVRGCRSGLPEITLLTEEYKPAVLCLQETLIREGRSIPLGQYSSIDQFVREGSSARGVSI